MSRTSRTGPTCRTATCLTRELSDYGRSIWVYAKYRHTALRASDAERFCSKLFTRMAEGGVLRDHLARDGGAVFATARDPGTGRPVHGEHGRQPVLHLCHRGKLKRSARRKEASA